MSAAQIHIPGYVVGTWDIDPLPTGSASACAI